MKFFSSNIEKNSYIFSKESFSYISGNGTLHFLAQDRKIKKISAPRKWNFLILILKNSLHLGIGNPEKILYIFSKENFSYISGNGTLQNFELQKLKKSAPRKFLILQETETPRKLLIFSQKKVVLIFRKMETPKRLFIFQETELSYISRNEAFLINISLIFQEVTFQARKIEKKTFLKSFLYFGKWNFLIFQEITCKA